MRFLPTRVALVLAGVAAAAIAGAVLSSTLIAGLEACEGGAPRDATLATVAVVATHAAILVLAGIAAFAVRGQLVERERREQETARVVELQERLLGVVGHDLRGPLTAIAGSAALLAKAKDLPRRNARLAELIVSSAARMSRLVRDMLDFTRVRAEGHLPVRPEPVNLGALCTQVVQEVRTARPEAHVRCEVEGDLTGEWDPTRLEQVVSNLVHNAVLHGAPDRPVVVRAAGLADAVRITVHNEGPPIPPELLPHVFDPFRSGEGGAQAGLGLGLGLHIVRTLVEAHGGRVNVVSGAEGTTFEVVLPAT